MNSNNDSTQTVVSQEWILQPWIVEPVLVERKRDADGRYLKRNCKLGGKVKVQSASNVALAAKFGEDADCLFA